MLLPDLESKILCTGGNSLEGLVASVVLDVDVVNVVVVGAGELVGTSKM
jgi:hypothetical protein